LSAARRADPAAVRALELTARTFSHTGRNSTSGNSEGPFNRGVLRTVRAGMLAVPSRMQQRLPHLTAHDVAKIDREVRTVLTLIGNGDDRTTRKV
jgi:hypothetical protein